MADLRLGDLLQAQAELHEKAKLEQFRIDQANLRRQRFKDSMADHLRLTASLLVDANHRDAADTSRYIDERRLQLHQLRTQINAIQMLIDAAPAAELTLTPEEEKGAEAGSAAAQAAPERASIGRLTGNVIARDHLGTPTPGPCNQADGDSAKNPDVDYYPPRFA